VCLFVCRSRVVAEHCKLRNRKTFHIHVPPVNPGFHCMTRLRLSQRLRTGLDTVHGWQARISSSHLTTFRTVPGRPSLDHRTKERPTTHKIWLIMERMSHLPRLPTHPRVSSRKHAHRQRRVDRHQSAILLSRIKTRLDLACPRQSRILLFREGRLTLPSQTFESSRIK
jgi:hypothetical protein